MNTKTRFTYSSRSDLHVGTSSANPQGPVKPVRNRALSDEHPETWRRKNSQARDMRTNLGRGKPSNVVVD